MDDENMILNQYADSKNFSARVELNRKFATNSYKGTSWMFDQLKFPNNANILELGCGHGLLWRTNSHKIPNNSHIILSDFSEGMLNDAKNSLNNILDKFEFKVINAEQIPHPNNSFDIIIANYMLYHVPNLDKALSEISRVLKPNGSLYATTIGLDHMKKLTKIVSDYDNDIKFSLKPLAYVFGLENGERLLNKYFKDVQLKLHNNILEVTEAEPLSNYILSTKAKNYFKGSKKEEFNKYIKNIIKSNGKIKIINKAGLFIAQNPIKQNQMIIK